MDHPGMQGGSAAPMDDSAADQSQGQSGYCVELHVKADGSMSVAVEPEQDEAAEGDDQGGQADKGTPVEGLKGAMQMIMQIVQNGGQVQDQGGGEDDFNAGYNEDKSGGSIADQLRRFA